MKKPFAKITWSAVALSILTAICVAACHDETSEKSKYSDPASVCCLDPEAQFVEIKLLPMGEISPKVMEQLKEDLLQGLESLASKIEDETFIPFDFEISILPKTALPDSCYYKPRGRYRADKLLRYLKQKYGRDHAYVIAVTDKDISSSIHGADDYGIQGLSYCPGNVTIMSTFRVKNKKHLWKLAAHEFCHGFFKLHHCPRHDPTCLIKDAEGGNPHFELKATLCDSCIHSISFD